MEKLFKSIENALVAGNIIDVKKFTEEGIESHVEAKQIIDNGLLAGMDIVGKKFKNGEMFIPEVLLCAKCMHEAIDILKPFLHESDHDRGGKVIIGTVEGDLHDIGKNLVSTMLAGSGFNVIDLGVNIAPNAFVEAVATHKPNIVAMSALLTTTMPKLLETIEALKESGLRDQVKIMAGGAPVTQEFVEKIGADAYGANAAIACEMAKSLLTGS